MPDTVTAPLRQTLRLRGRMSKYEYAGKRRQAGTMPKTKITETASIGMASDPNAADSAAISELMKTPEAQNYVRDRISGGLKSALEKTLQPEFRDGSAQPGLK
ncbi:MAG: hypothetical protein HOP09_06160 [Hyphomicrobium sp.]|nr:hypothetical protein [Hyphomicrobium sp.]